MWPGCIAWPTEQRKVMQHHSNTGTSRLIQQKLNALACSSGTCWSTRHCAPPVSPSLRQDKSTTYGTETISTQYYSSLALTCRGIILDSAHLFSLHLSTIICLFCGLPLQCLLLLHLRCTCQVASPRPYQLYSCFPCFSVPSSPGSESWHIYSMPRLRAALYCLLLKPRAHLYPASLLPATLAPLTQLIPGVCPKKTPGICIQTQSWGKQTSGLSTLQIAHVNPKCSNMSAVILPLLPPQ